ncbi:MAG TPA: glycosyltransferase [Terriglobales bacterium]|nr:glycosyltransferase [Terriglobales bacterium]
MKVNSVSELGAIDVVVPCYNYGRYLESCVRSILDQEAVDVRVLIIDDASPDNTAAVAQELAARDQRVTLLRHAVNRGNINTYNEGIEWASAEYFLLLSADDYLLPGALARAAAVFNEHPEVAFTHGNAAVAKAGQPLPAIGPAPLRAPYRVTRGQAFIAEACAESAHNRVWTPTAVVRTALQKEVGGYRTDLPHAGDLHLWLRLACRGSVAKINAWQAVYRTHDANMHYSYPKLKNLRQHLLAFDSVFDEDRDRIASGPALQQLYRRNIAIAALRHAQHDLLNAEQSDCAQQDYVDFAVALDPGIKSTPVWWQLRVLQVVGGKLASATKSIVAAPVRAIRRGTRALRVLVSATH